MFMTGIYMIERPVCPSLGTRSEDVLSSVLGSIHLESGAFARPVMRAPWGVQFEHDRLADRLGADGNRLAAFHAMVRGSAFLRMEGKAPISVSAGDLLVFPRADDHIMSDTVDRPAVPIGALIEAAGSEEAAIAQIAQGVGAETTIVCGYFIYERQGAHPLLSMLPPLIHIKGEEGRSVEWLDTTLTFMASEVSRGDPGSRAVMHRLTDILFIQVVRSYIEQLNGHGGGWLRGLRDERVSKALAAVHADPSRAWTVADLAKTAGVSRTVLARRFNELVGEPPLQYLTRWRMQKATEDLAHPAIPLIDVAQRAGYGSEAAFSRVFKKMIGTPPATYRRRLLNPPGAVSMVST